MGRIPAGFNDKTDSFPQPSANDLTQVIEMTANSGRSKHSNPPPARDSKRLYVPKLLTQLSSSWPHSRWAGYNVVVAVSGGADSVCLLRALVEINAAESSTGDLGDTGDNDKKLVVAHFDHRTRGDDSERDQAFVESLAKKNGLEFAAGSFEASKDNSNLNNGQTANEEAFRDSRYQFLTDVARQHQARYIALGHHAQDQIETILFRIFRGTGLTGLKGMPRQRVIDDSITIVRPLMDVDQRLIRNALMEWGQDFRSDASNETNDYTRNFIRNEVVPTIKSRFENTFDSAVLRLGHQASQQQDFLRTQVEPLLNNVTFEPDLVSFDCQSLSGTHVVVVRELLSEIWNRTGWEKSQMSFEQFDQVALLILDQHRDEPGFHLPGKISCRKQEGQLTLAQR
jgi:tRNA(Ile)-lysidine synthase